MIKGLYQKLDGPFYKQKEKLYLYDDKDLVILQLYGDKIGTYLTNDD